MSRWSFRTKLVLSFALAALVPLTAILLISSQVMRAAFEDDAAQRTSRASELLQQQLGLKASELRQTLGSLSQDYELRELLLGWSRSGEARAQRRAQSVLIEWLQKTMERRNLELLQLTSGEGVIVASGAETGRFNDQDLATLERARRHPDTAVLAPFEGLRLSGLALQVSTDCGEPGRPIWLTGGVFVDEQFLDQLPVDDQDALLVLLPGRRPLSNRSQAADRAVGLLSRPDQREPLQRLRDDGFQAARVPLAGLAGSDSLSVLIATSPERLNQRLVRLNLAFAALAALGVALAWGSGLVLSRPASVQVERLVEALARVAAGDLEARVEVRRDDELGQVARAFNAMTRELAENKERLLAAERVAAWRDIARRLAHEIKNPLSPIQLSIETLRKCWQQQRPEFGEVLDESTATIVEEVQRLRRIVQEFSDFARLPKPHLQPADLNEVARSVASLHAGLDGPHRLELELCDQDCRAQFDPDQLTQALLNLVKNAIEAMPSGGRVLMQTRCTADSLEVAVADQGPGLAGDAREHLFEPYWTTKPSGTGLGLAIVHRIAGEHGGRVRVSELEPRGTRFSIELPRRSNPRGVSAPG